MHAAVKVPPCEPICLRDEDARAIWLLDCSAWEGDPAAELAMLTPAEQARARQFRFDRERRRFTIAHATLRRLLAERACVAPARQRMVFQRHRQPIVLAPSGWHVSLSYSGDHTLIGLSRAPIGIDLEMDRRIEDAAALSELHFTPQERRELAAQAPVLRSRAFLLGWTRKEACIKLTGQGLTLPTAMLASGLEPDARALIVDGGAIEVESVATGGRPIAAWARFARNPEVAGRVYPALT
jgi:4'-phosphopantetheinyl transferase